MKVFASLVGLALGSSSWDDGDQGKSARGCGTKVEFDVAQYNSINTTCTVTINLATQWAQAGPAAFYDSLALAGGDKPNTFTFYGVDGITQANGPDGTTSNLEVHVKWAEGQCGNETNIALSCAPDTGAAPAQRLYMGYHNDPDDEPNSLAVYCSGGADDLEALQLDPAIFANATCLNGNDLAAGCDCGSAQTDLVFVEFD